MGPSIQAAAVRVGIMAALLALAGTLHSQDATEDKTQKLLRELAEKVERQAKTIEELNRKVAVLEAAQDSAAPVPAGSLPPSPGLMESSPVSQPGLGFGNVRISGEGGVGFFNSQHQGAYPNAEFRVDEARLFLEAPVIKDTYFFAELVLASREQSDLDARAGELYLDVEDLSRLWNQERQFNVRAGRFDIPFGEEYLARDIIANPLISHSIMDLWGVDEGVEAYGTVSGVDYVLAVQNGGPSAVHDYDADKAVIARIGGRALPWLRLSASAMRTGEMDPDDDGATELWLGPGLIYSLGSPATTEFEADLLQGDIEAFFDRTRFHAAGGVLRYDDDDPAANNRREVYYYYVEAEHRIYEGFYAATRWSQVFADDGFPIIGNGDSDLYYTTFLTEDLWRLSLGLGYRWSPRLVWKAEYSFERGHVVGGGSRKHEDMVSTVVAFAF